jgi:protein-tyrosine phosphatase
VVSIRGWLAGLIIALPFSLAHAAADVEQVVVAELLRHIRLDGASNFRDLGGYGAADGRKVKVGRLFRSNNLSRLSVADWQTLERVGVNLVVDFRSDEEVRATPPTQPASIRRVGLPMGLAGMDIEDLRRRMAAGDFDAMPSISSYTQLTLTQSEKYRQWFRLLEENVSGASVFHCSSGKDRTGLGAALFLLALGVPRQTVLEDFEASNVFLRADTERMMTEALRRNPSLPPGDQKKLRSLLGVDKEWMIKTFDDLTLRHGSIDGYLETALGLDAARRERLKALYLE